jgi:hypothetical protein
MDYRSDYQKRGVALLMYNGDTLHSSQDRPELPQWPDDATTKAACIAAAQAATENGLNAEATLFMNHESYIDTQMDLHPDRTRAEIEAELEENTRNEELRQQQAELAARVGFTWCEHKCEQEPLLARHPLLTAEQNAERVMQHRERLRVAGFEDMPHHAGLVKRCADCREKSPTFEWIADIPFAAFKKWMDEHDFAFCLDEMKVLLPPDPIYFAPVRVPYRTVLLTGILKAVSSFYEVAGEEKPKGGFEFL